MQVPAISATPVFAGIDVSKSELVIATGTCLETIANTPKDIATWLDSLPAGSTLAVEATGGYETAILLAGHAAGHRCYCLNPKDVRHYARAIGLRAKTDGVDARMLARYIEHEHGHLHRWQPSSERQTEIDTLLRRRDTLVGSLVKVRLALTGVPPLAASLKALVAQYTQTLKVIEQQLRALVAGSEPLSQLYGLLRSIPGVGPLNATQLANVLTRIRFARSDALVAFVGLDPRPHDSGQSRGVRRLSKRGSALMRKLLYTAAMAACRNLTFRPIYQALRARGLPSTAAYNIVARKILRIAFAVYKSNQPFNPAMVGKTT